jgi:hypothetical protein
MTPIDAAKSFLYYQALSDCANSSNLYRASSVLESLTVSNNRIRVTDANAGLWFDNGTLTKQTTSGAYFLTGSTSNSDISCSGDTSVPWITNAVTNSWGYKNGVDALCSFGAVRVDKKNCEDDNGGSSDFTGNKDSGSKINVKTIQTAIKNKVYGGDTPTLSKAQEYKFYLDSFNASCLGDTNPQPDTTNDTGDKVYSISVIDTMGNTDALFTKYDGVMSQNDQVFLYGSVSKTCSQMAATINADASAYKKEAMALAANGGAGDTSLTTTPQVATTDTSCGSQVSGLGWIICPIISGLTGLNDFVWKLVSYLLVVNPLDQSDSIYTAWGSIRSIANVLFVIFFLVIIFSQLTGAGITNYGVKKMLPRVIIAAILVNVSFIIVQISVDLANILGSSLFNLITGITPPITATWGGLVSLILGSAAGAGGIVIGGIAVGIAGGTVAVIWMLLPLAAIATLALLAALLTLIFRQAAIPILAILAPLAFVAYLLPNTESWFKKWRGMLLSMLMLYPMAALVFAGAQFAASAIINEGGYFNMLIGLIILSLPLFSLPFLARQGGPILSKVGGVLSGIAKSAGKPIQGMSKERADQARADYLQSKPTTPRTGIGRRLDSSWAGRLRPKRVARDAALRKFTREQDAETNKTNLQTEMKGNTTGHMGDSLRPTTGQRRREGGFGQTAGTGGSQAVDNLAFAKKAAGNEEAGATHLRAGTTTGIALDKAEERLGIVHETDKALTKHRVAESAEGQIAHRALGTAKLQTDVDTNEIATRIETDPTLLNLRLQARDANTKKSTAEAHTADLYDQASTDTVAVAGTDLAAVSPAMRAAAKINKTASLEAAGTAQFTKHVVDKEFANRVAPQYIIPAGTMLRDGTVLTEDIVEIPDTQAARDIAGIDPNGVRLAQAIATAGISKAKADNVTAVRTLLAAQHYTGGEDGDYMRVVEQGMRRDGTAASPEDIEVSMDAIARTGSIKGLARIQNRLADLHRTGDPEAAQLQQAFNDILIASGKKAKSTGGVTLGQLAAGNLTDTFEAGLLAYAQAGKFAASEFVTMDKDEISMLAETLGSALVANPTIVPSEQITALRAAITGALTDPLYRNSIPPEKRAQLDALMEATDPTNRI